MLLYDDRSRNENATINMLIIEKQRPLELLGEQHEGK